MEHSKKIIAAGVTLLVSTTTNASNNAETVEQASLKLHVSQASVSHSVERFDFENGNLNVTPQTDSLLVNKKAWKKRRHQNLNSFERFKLWLLGESGNVSS